MLTISNPRSQALILGAIIVVVLPARVALRQQYAAERHRIERQGRRESSQEMAAQWNALRYTDAVSENVTKAFLAKIDGLSLSLTELNKARLEQRLKEALDYLQNPTFEEYYRLKTAGLRWQFELSDRVPKFLRRSALLEQGTEKPTPRELVKSVWDAINTPKAGVPHRITSVCLDHIGMETSRTNSPHAIMGEKASIGFTMAREAIDPGFQYVDPQRSSSMGSAPELFVHISFFAHSNVAVEAGPVYLSLYWSEPDQNWALSRMFTDVLLRMDALF